MIVLFLSGMVAMIIVRTLHRDITKYNQLESGEDAQEETGWKLVSRPAWWIQLAVSPRPWAQGCWVRVFAACGGV